MIFASCFLVFVLLASCNQVSGRAIIDVEKWDKCRPIPIQDIKDAVHAAQAIYYPMKKGEIVSGKLQLGFIHSSPKARIFTSLSH